MATVAYKVRSENKEHFILIESSDDQGIPRNASKDIVRKVAKELGEQLEPLSAVADTIRNALIAANNPSEIEVEFGLELGGEGGIPMIVEGSAKANFKITLRWANDRKTK
jgi:hypothetical protein